MSPSAGKHGGACTQGQCRNQSVVPTVMVRRALRSTMLERKPAQAGYRGGASGDRFRIIAGANDRMPAVADPSHLGRVNQSTMVSPRGGSGPCMDDPSFSQHAQGELGFDGFDLRPADCLGRHRVHDGYSFVENHDHWPEEEKVSSQAHAERHGRVPHSGKSRPTNQNRLGSHQHHQRHRHSEPHITAARPEAMRVRLHDTSLPDHEGDEYAHV